jgi:hypothetical protein
MREMGSPMNNARTKEREADWVAKLLLGLVLGSVIFCAGLLAFPIWSGITQIASGATATHSCVSMNDDTARLECYDRQAGKHPASPAKGPYLFNLN